MEAYRRLPRYKSVPITPEERARMEAIFKTLLAARDKNEVKKGERLRDPTEALEHEEEGARDRAVRRVR